MSRLSVRNVSEAAQRALRVRAGLSGRSVEGELREIIELATLPVQRYRVGQAMLNIALSFGTISLYPPRDAPAEVIPE